MMTQPAERFEHTPMDSVLIAHPTLVYVGVKDRAQFDSLAVPYHDHGENERGHVLTKCIEQDGVRVVFQYWLKSLTAAAYLDLRKKERASASEEAK